MERLVLPPGFRFHPTDEELVSHYLKRKVCGRKIDFEAITEIDLYKHEPWDLPEKSFLQTRDLEWYFFVPRDRKYTNGSRTNRATEKGYWKSTGKDRFVSSASRIVGTKKTLVYYSGRAPKGDRTNWVMHEYRLNDSECERARASQNGYVLCRIYQKSGAGPKNGEQYGAPVEDDDDFVSSPAAEQDRCGSFTASLLEVGPPMASVHVSESPVSISGKEAVFNGMERRLCCPDIQLRSLQFVDSASNTVSEVLQRESNSFTKENLGQSVNPKDFVVVPSECHEEEKIIRELYELVSDPDRTNSKEGFEGSDNFVVTEHLGTDALPPRYGDFLELDDLMTVSGIEEGLEDSIGPVHGTNDCQWQDSSFGDQWKDKQQNGSKETGILQSLQMESPSYSSGLNAQYQAVRDILLEDLLPPRGGLKNEVVGVAHHTDSIEPDYEDVLEFFDQISACATKNKPFSLECLAENMQKGLLQSEVWKNDIVVPSEDGQYEDAGASLPCIFNSQVEPGNLTKHAALVGSVGALPALEGMAALNNEVCSVHQESLVKPTDRTTDGSHLPQAEGTIASVQAKHSPSPLSLLWNCLDSLPTLPASAADLSPQAAVSLRITSFAAEEVIEEHETDFDLGKKLVKALSFNEQKIEAMTKGWSMGFWALALLGGVWAVFWLLIVGGGWNLLGGVYRFMVPNER